MADTKSDETPAAAYSSFQHCGVLFKRPIGHESAKWSRRFFVIKDGFLFYYADGAQKMLEKSRVICLHPKGILPLGGCKVETAMDTGHPYCILITSEETTSRVFLASENEMDRDRWVRAIEQASRITWRNCQMSDAVIQQLERRCLEMTNNKSDLTNLLKKRTEDLENESLITQELKVINDELRKEKAKIEQLASTLQQQREDLKRQLMAKTSEADELIEKQKRERDEAMRLQEQLQELSVEKQRIADDLIKEQTTADKLARDRHYLSLEACTLNNKLALVESKMAELANQKSQVENSLNQYQKQTDKLNDEKQQITERAEQLKHSLEELAHQKETTEAELKDEMAARVLAEQRLQEAEQCLARVEQRLHESTQPEPVIIELMADVNTLKKYFENVAFEAKVDARKTMMIKRSLEARKEKRRQVKTMLLDSSDLPQLHGHQLCVAGEETRNGQVTSNDILLRHPSSPGDGLRQENLMAGRHTCVYVSP